MLLHLENINKSYIQGKMDVPVLHDINLDIEEGEYVAIMGPSGSGKSTLMNIIGCLDKPTDGSYILDDVEVAGMKDKELSVVRNKSIGFVFQNFNLLPRQSALQNVELPLQYAKVPRRLRKEKCKEALASVDLSDRINFKPTQLSGGQKQRVAIARAMVNSPKILLADEPTGALDSKSGLQVMGLFEKLHSEGVTIIMITHAKEIAEYADRIITIFDGRVTSDEMNENKRTAVYENELKESVASAGYTDDELEEDLEEIITDRLKKIQTDDASSGYEVDGDVMIDRLETIKDEDVSNDSGVDGDALIDRIQSIKDEDAEEKEGDVE